MSETPDNQPDDGLFHICDGSFIITWRKGQYFQRQVYIRGDRLFFKAPGGGYVGITSRGTTATDEKVEDTRIDFEVGYDTLGRMVRKVVA